MTWYHPSLLDHTTHYIPNWTHEPLTSWSCHYMITLQSEAYIKKIQLSHNKKLPQKFRNVTSDSKEILLSSLQSYLLIK